MNKENKQGINSEYFIFLFIWIMCDDIEGVILAGSDYWGGYNPSNPPVNYAYEWAAMAECSPPILDQFQKWFSTSVTKV